MLNFKLRGDDIVVQPARIGQNIRGNPNFLETSQWRISLATKALFDALLKLLRPKTART